jgi:chorismate synthase
MNLRYLTAGESHGPALLVILEGMPAGLYLDIKAINNELARRQKGFGTGPRMNIEKDEACIMAGLMEGLTTGAPLGIQIKNNDHENWRGRSVSPFTVPRPGHADLVGAIKYGYRDLRPALERASARETAARVAVGAICKQFLACCGIQIGGYVTAIGEVEADLGDTPFAQRISRADDSDVRCPSPLAADSMHTRIRQIMDEKETLGGVLEIVVLHVPPGLGSFVQWDRRLDARLGAAVLSVPAIKGMEIGPAFENARLTGSQVQDAIFLEEDRLIRRSNRAGGLEAGVTTGEPLVIRAAMKPIATTLRSQPSVDLTTGEPVETHYERSDFCPVPRAVPVLEAVVAFVIVEALLEKLGGDSMEEIMPRLEAMRTAHLSALNIDGKEHIFWPE